jgi:Uma2 family endonuclease
MIVTLPRRRLTYEEYKQLPDDERYELLEGELVLTPAPTHRHQRILSRLFLRLGLFVEERRLGEVLTAPIGVVFSADTTLQPDLLYTSRDQGSTDDLNQDFQGAPDLIIEIISPSNPEHDRITKRQAYSRYGVQEYWIVDPYEESVEVLTQQGAGLEVWQRFTKNETLTSPLLTGLRLDLSLIFS